MIHTDGARTIAHYPGKKKAQTPVVIVVRDPDASNEYATFGGSVETYDIDAGYADLSDREEFQEWYESHLEGARRLEAEGHRDAAAYIRGVIESYIPDDVEVA